MKSYMIESDDYTSPHELSPSEQASCRRAELLGIHECDVVVGNIHNAEALAGLHEQLIQNPFAAVLPSDPTLKLYHFEESVPVVLDDEACGVWFKRADVDSLNVLLENTALSADRATK